MVNFYLKHFLNKFIYNLKTWFFIFEQTEEERAQYTGHKEVKAEKSNKRSLTGSQIKYSGTSYTAFQYSKSSTAPVNTYKSIFQKNFVLLLNERFFKSLFNKFLDWTSTWTFAPENQGNWKIFWKFWKISKDVVFFPHEYFIWD